MVAEFQRSIYVPLKCSVALGFTFKSGDW